MAKTTIIQAIEDQHLFGSWFKNPETWQPWMTLLKGVYCLPMNRSEFRFFKKCTNKRKAPAGPVTAVYLIVGRRGGKSFITALNGVYLATFRDYRQYLSPGERAHVVIIAVDRRQAQVLMGYVKALINGVPMLRAMVMRETAESIELSNQVTIEIFTASFRSTRGYTIAAALCDEISFWRTEDSTNPDKEIIAALKPGMATIPGSMLFCIGSPYARRGVQWEAYKNNYGKNDPHVLVWQASSLVMNPALDEQIVKDAYANDPIAADAEYGGMFRRDVEGFISIEALEACVEHGRYELPPTLGLKHQLRYQGFVDPSGGSADSMTLAISHREGEKVVLDCIRERKPPFSPEEVVKEFVALLKSYNITRITGDRYAGEWPRERFQKHGVVYEPSEKTRSELYLELLPVLNAGTVELLDNKTLLHQFQGLERRTGTGRDIIDHAPNGHDDVSNAVAGAVYCCRGVRPMTVKELEEGSMVGNPFGMGRQLKENSSWESVTDSGQDYVRTPEDKRWDW